MVDVHAVLAKLATKRPVFHSEADFQHALAWEIHEQNQGADVRLEKRILTGNSRVHLDLLFQSEINEVAIELKYKTRAIKLQIADENFDLLNQSAQDIGRHDFIKDICRLERYVNEKPRAVGYAILLTNDHLYWNNPRKENPVDLAFRLDQGRVLEGRVAWNDEASAGTKLKREEPIDLTGKYTISWCDYFNHGEGKYTQFRYTVVKIANAINQNH